MMEGFRAYLTAEGRLAATQEAAGKGFTQVTVPYKKAELVDFINGMLEEVPDDGSYDATGPVELETPLRQQPEAWPGEHPYHAVAQGRTQGVDQICAHIFNADPVTLSRYATSVSMAYNELGRGK